MPNFTDFLKHMGASACRGLQERKGWPGRTHNECTTPGASGAKSAARISTAWNYQESLHRTSTSWYGGEAMGTRRGDAYPCPRHRQDTPVPGHDDRGHHTGPRSSV